MTIYTNIRWSIYLKKKNKNLIIKHQDWDLNIQKKNKQTNNQTTNENVREKRFFLFICGYETKPQTPTWSNFSLKESIKNERERKKIYANDFDAIIMHVYFFFFFVLLEKTEPKTHFVCLSVCLLFHIIIIIFQ